MAVKTIDAKTLKSWLDKKEAVLVDVREPAEHAARNIPGSVLVPLSNICKAAIPEHKGKKLVLHCLKGGRGGSACEKLLSETPDLELYNLEGGIGAWAEAGYPVNSSGFAMPLDQQVQLAIGIIVLTGTALGYFVNPQFLIITGLVGLGLTVAGLTGFCGLKLLLGKMPWNKA